MFVWVSLPSLCLFLSASHSQNQSTTKCSTSVSYPHGPRICYTNFVNFFWFYSSHECQLANSIEWSDEHVKNLDIKKNVFHLKAFLDVMICVAVQPSMQSFSPCTSLNIVCFCLEMLPVSNFTQWQYLLSFTCWHFQQHAIPRSQLSRIKRFKLKTVFLSAFLSSHNKTLHTC